MKSTSLRAGAALLLVPALYLIARAADLPIPELGLNAAAAPPAQSRVIIDLPQKQPLPARRSLAPWNPLRPPQPEAGRDRKPTTAPPRLHAAARSASTPPLRSTPPAGEPALLPAPPAPTPSAPAPTTATAGQGDRQPSAGPQRTPPSPPAPPVPTVAPPPIALPAVPEPAPVPVQTPVPTPSVPPPPALPPLPAPPAAVPTVETTTLP